MEFFNPKNHTDTSLKRRIRIRERQIKDIKKELGINDMPEYQVVAEELNVSDFAKKLELWRNQKK